MLVYRVEHSELMTGPYRTGGRAGEDLHDLAYALETHHGGSSDHPPAWRDGLADPDDDYRFGFASRSALRAWFKGWGERLEGMSFQVSVYRVPAHKVQRGERQLVFDVEQAELVTAIAPTKLIPE